MDIYENLANLMKALAHPTRLQILQILDAEGEACVCHLEACLEQRQAYISQQLAKLRDAGLVEDRRDGLNVYYALAFKGLSPLMAAAAKVVSDVSTGNGAFQELDDLVTAAGDCPCPRCEKVGISSIA